MIKFFRKIKWKIRKYLDRFNEEKIAEIENHRVSYVVRYGKCKALSILYVLNLFDYCRCSLSFFTGIIVKLFNTNLISDKCFHFLRKNVFKHKTKNWSLME